MNKEEISELFSEKNRPLIEIIEISYEDHQRILQEAYDMASEFKENDQTCSDTLTEESK